MAAGRDSEGGNDDKYMYGLHKGRRHLLKCARKTSFNVWAASG